MNIPISTLKHDAKIPADGSDPIARIKEFLLYEADLLDDWRLNEWFSLFEGNTYYSVATSSSLSEPSSASLPIIKDDYERLRERVNHLVSGDAWAERPRSRTRRILSNFRHIESEEFLQIRTNFVVYQFRHGECWNFVGTSIHRLIRQSGTYRIAERAINIEHENLAAQRRISIII